MNKGLSRRSKESLFSVLPAGVVMPFAGETAPEGWGFCDGSLISRTDYPELFVALGTSHGEGDGSTTFHLPDYRGRFLRGTDSSAGRDPDAGIRAASNFGGNTGDSVGSVQGEDTNGGSLSAGGGGTHGHTIYTGLNDSGSFHAPGGAVGHIGIGGGSAFGGKISGDGSHSHSISGGVETRSINANVNYIIKL